MDDWQPIKTAPKEVWSFDPVDLWLDIYASPRSFGMADSFRVTDCYRENGSGVWGHDYKGKFEPLQEDYITYWKPINKPKATQ